MPADFFVSVDGRAVPRAKPIANRKLRRQIFTRDGWRCKNCGITVAFNLADAQCSNFTKRLASLDHILPMSRGGQHNHDNLQTLCRECNTAKGNSTKLPKEQKPRRKHCKWTDTERCKGKTVASRWTARCELRGIYNGYCFHHKDCVDPETGKYRMKIGSEWFSLPRWDQYPLLTPEEKAGEMFPEEFEKRGTKAA